MTIERSARIRTLTYASCQLVEAMESIWAIGVGLVPKKVENKQTNKGKYSCLIKETCVYFPLFVIRKKWSLIVDEAARQGGEGFDAAIA